MHPTFHLTLAFSMLDKMLDLFDRGSRDHDFIGDVNNGTTHALRVTL